MRLWSPGLNYTTYPLFQAYAVEGWWLHNFLKRGKLTRQTYLTLGRQVTVGFQKKLADCKAAERFLRDEAVHEAVSAAGSLGTNQAANESFPRSGGPGQFVLGKF